MNALRQLVASFTVEVDRAGALERGNAQVAELKNALKGIDPIAKSTSLALSSGFFRVAESANAMTSAVARAAATVRSLGSGGGVAGLLGSGGGGQLALAGGGGLAGGGRGGALGPPGVAGLLSAGGDPFANWRDAFGAGGAGGGGLLDAVKKFGPAVDASSNMARGALKGVLDAVVSIRFAMTALAGSVVLGTMMRLVDSIGGIGEEASKLGVTNAEFQRLDVLAKQNAASVQSLGTAFRTVGKAAADPTKETTAAFRALRIETKNADGTFKSRNELFFETAGALADISDGTKRSTMAQQLFGRSALEIAPLMANGRAGLEAQRAELEKLPVVTDAAIEAADHLSDRWPASMQRLKAVAGVVLEKFVLPALETLIDLVDGSAKAFTGFLKTFSPLTIGLAALVVGMSPLISTMRALVALGGGWQSLAKTVAGGAWQMTKAILPAVAAFLVLEDVFTFFAGGDSLIGRGLEAALGPGITKAAQDLTEAFKDMWKWILGDGAGEKFKSLMSEMLQGLQLLVNDALALIPGSGRVAGLQGMQDFESGAMPRSIPVRALGGVDPNDPFLKAMGESFKGQGSVSVTINNPPPGEGLKIAGQVKGVLERPRDAVLSQVQ